jgi:hypothetical protein
VNRRYIVDGVIWILIACELQLSALMFLWRAFLEKK